MNKLQDCYSMHSYFLGLALFFTEKLELILKNFRRHFC